MDFMILCNFDTILQDFAYFGFYRGFESFTKSWILGFKSDFDNNDLDFDNNDFNHKSWRDRRDANYYCSNHSFHW